MSVRDTTNAAEILARYGGGFFPLYDLAGRFYWERLSIRAVLPVTTETVERATRMARRERNRFEIRYTTAVEVVIAALQDERVKPRTWVRSEVVSIYRTLHRAGLLQTIEAWDKGTGKLAGAVVGLVLPGVFVAETMFGVTSDASKICLCRLMEDALAVGHRLIDVQTPHHLDENGLPRARHGRTPHPCVRLGEEVITHSRFMRGMEAAMRGAFGGRLADWLDISTAISREREGVLAEVPREWLRAAWPMLRNNFPAAVVARVDGELSRDI